MESLASVKKDITKKGPLGPFFYVLVSLPSSSATVKPAITIRIAPSHCHEDIGSPSKIFADIAATISSESINIPIRPGERYWFILRRIRKVGKKIKIETKKIGIDVLAITFTGGISNLKNSMKISVMNAPKKYMGRKVAVMSIFS